MRHKPSIGLCQVVQCHAAFQAPPHDRGRYVQSERINLCTPKFYEKMFYLHVYADVGRIAFKYETGQQYQPF